MHDWRRIDAQRVQRCLLLGAYLADVVYSQPVVVTGFATDPTLLERPMLVAVSKCDLPEAREAHEAVAAALEPRGYQVFAISSATGDGIAPLLEALEATARAEVDA